MQSRYCQSRYREFLWPVALIGLFVIDFMFTDGCRGPRLQAGEPNPKKVTGSVTNSPEKQDDGLLQESRRHFKQLSGAPSSPTNADLVSLGQKLFFDPRISADGTVSCGRCHLAALYGTDGLAKSHGAHDKVLPRNAATVFNSGLNFKQHWRGEIPSVEEQAKKALLGPAFANPDYLTAMSRVKAISGYTEMFRKCFPGPADPVTEDNWGEAIGAYERTLLTPSRFDEYLGGKTEALTTEERHGLRTFISTGCASCHSGVGVGAHSFEKFGMVEDYWAATGSKEVDKGRFDLTKNEDDLYVFKVPGLRNVEMTPPYFHDGSAEQLPDAVRVMARVQFGTTLNDADTTAIVTFLKCLTGKPPQNFIEAPVLPAAGFSEQGTK